MQKPTIGRIVHYRLPAGAPPIEGERVFPAVIVRVRHDGEGELAAVVNLRIWTDGYENMWMKDVTLHQADTGDAGSAWWPARS